jgi:hypothetical protein
MDSMSLNELLSLLKSVLTTPEVIGVTIVMAIYVNIVVYIVRYRKHVPQPKRVRVRPAAAVAANADEEDEGAAPSGKKSSKKSSRGAQEAADEEELVE